MQHLHIYCLGVLWEFLTTRTSTKTSIVVRCGNIHIQSWKTIFSVVLFKTTAALGSEYESTVLKIDQI